MDAEVAGVPKRRGPDLIEDPVGAGWLLAQIKAKVLQNQKGMKPSRATLDEETRRRLHALGYV